MTVNYKKLKNHPINTGIFTNHSITRKRKTPTLKNWHSDPECEPNPINHHRSQLMRIAKRRIYDGLLRERRAFRRRLSRARKSYGQVQIRRPQECHCPTTTRAGTENTHVMCITWAPLTSDCCRWKDLKNCEIFLRFDGVLDFYERTQSRLISVYGACKIEIGRWWCFMVVRDLVIVDIFWTLICFIRTVSCLVAWLS